MADSKISALASTTSPAQVAAQVAVNDAGTSKKMPLSDLGWQISTASTSVGTGTTCDITIPSGFSEVMVKFLGISHNSGSSQTFRGVFRQRTGGTDSGNANISASISAASALSGFALFRTPDSNPVTFECQLQSASTPSPPNHSLGSGAAFAGLLHLTGGISNFRVQPTSGNFDAGTYEVWVR